MKVLRIVLFVVIVVGFALSRMDKSKSKPPKKEPAPAYATVLKNTDTPEQFKPFPKGTLFDKHVHREFAVYYLPKSKKDPKETLRTLCSTQFKTFHLMPKFSKEALEQEQWPLVAPMEVSIDKYRPMDAAHLKYSGRGLSATEIESLQKCEEVFVVGFADEGAPAYASLKMSQQLMLALAKETGGILWDESTRETFALDAWEKYRINRWTSEVPNLTDHFTAHYYSNGELTRFVTLGMSKFGLPEVSVENITRSSSRSMGSLVNVLCQTLAEKGTLEKEGKIEIDIQKLKNDELRKSMINSYLDKATGKATLSLAEALPQEGDNENRLIEIHFAAKGGDDVNTQQEAILAQVFGSSDSISYVSHDDEIKRLSEKAKLELKKLYPTYKAGLPAGEVLLVKAPFKTPKGHGEWMWVEIVKWDGPQIEGILMNDPFDIPTLKAGARVNVQQDSVFDYIHQKANGVSVGNETGEYMQKREKQGK